MPPPQPHLLLLTAEARTVQRMFAISHGRLTWKVSPAELPAAQEMGGQLQSLPWPFQQYLFFSKISCKACLTPFTNKEKLSTALSGG